MKLAELGARSEVSSLPPGAPRLPLGPARAAGRYSQSALAELWPRPESARTPPLRQRLVLGDQPVRVKFVARGEFGAVVSNGGPSFAGLAIEQKVQQSAALAEPCRRASLAAVPPLRRHPGLG
jgi:hypothetical protein